MKNMKKIFALAIALIMIMAMGASVFGQTEHGTDVTTNKGAITITNATIGKKYGIYKIFDATVALNSDGTPKLDSEGKPIINYTVPSGKTLPADNTWFEKDSAGNVSLKSGADITTDAFKEWVTSFATVVKKDVEATESSLTFDRLEFGYYYIESEVGGTLTIDSTTPTATVVDKNQEDSFDKKIVEEGEETAESGTESGTEGDSNSANLVAVNEAGLNEDIDYQITVEGVNYIGEEKVYKYVVKDTLGNAFTYNAAPTVTVAGAAPIESVTISYKDKNGAATSNISEAQSFEIIVPWAEGGVFAGNHLYDSNAQILVTYTAHLDPAKYKALLDAGTLDTAHKNEAEVDRYKSKETPEEEVPTGVGTKTVTETYSTSLQFKKIDGATKNPLKGAEFTLTGPNGPVTITVTQTFAEDENGTYWKLKDGTYTTQDPNGTIDGKPVDKSVYDSETTKYAPTTVTAIENNSGASTGSVCEVGDDGVVRFVGLAAGDYTVTETKVPDGYNAIDPINFTISFDSENKKFSADNGIVLDEQNNYLTLDVENNKGTELPSTGGMGTTLFYIFGIILVLGGSIFLVSRRRMVK